ALELVGLALGLQLGVAGNLARRFLDGAFGLIGRALHSVLVDPVIHGVDLFFLVSDQRGHDSGVPPLTIAGAVTTIYCRSRTKKLQKPNRILYIARYLETGPAAVRPV